MKITEAFKWVGRAKKIGGWAKYLWAKARGKAGIIFMAVLFGMGAQCIQRAGEVIDQIPEPPIARPRPSPTATESAPEPTSTKATPTPTTTPSATPAAPTPAPVLKPPVLKGINGGSECKLLKVEGDFVRCELGFTQIFQGTDGHDGPCDPDHFCWKGSAYYPETKSCQDNRTFMADECHFRDYDEFRKINEGGFIVVVTGADLIPGSAGTHSIRVRGLQGAMITVRKCPADDIQTKDGHKLTVRGEFPFDKKGCDTTKPFPLPRKKK